MGRTRHLRRLARGIAPLLTALAALVVAVATIRLAVNDAFRWSQYLYWLPSPVLVTAAAALWTLASAAGAVMGRAWAGAASRARVVVGAGVALLALHAALVDYRLQNRLFGSGAGGRSALRVVHWNASGVHGAEAFASPLLGQDPDIVATVDAYGANWPSFGEGPGAPTIVRQGNMMVLSRYPVLRHGWTMLGISSAGPASDEPDEQALRLLRHVPLLRHAAAPDGLHPHHDPGRAMYIEIDTREALGRTMVLWVIDLPSDVRLHRRDVTREAMGAIRAWRGEEVVREDGAARVRGAGPGFPAPDLIVGDFNIPRGSRSLRALTLGYAHAHAQAGWGHSGTYPRHRPLVHIDNMYVGPALRAVRYEIVDAGAGSHRMQVGEIAKRK